MQGASSYVLYFFIRTEQEVTENMKMLHLIAQKLELEMHTPDQEVSELSQNTEIAPLVEKSKRHASMMPCIRRDFSFPVGSQSLTFRNRKALLMTETELRLIAAPAKIGLSSKPKNG